ncbi:unnamed protein product [Dicrocoelium dendriticum]|nr:unnamed protein product [Dicrocoelium dendriticum]
MTDFEDSLNSSNSESYFRSIALPPVTVLNTEQDEDCIFKGKAKLYRYDRAEEPPEWKDRGTGYVKILQHKSTGRFRLLMRRDRTFKVCANHAITPQMQLRPNCGSDRAFVWQTRGDFSDEVPNSEPLGIRFPTVTDAQSFKECFEKARNSFPSSRSDNSPIASKSLPNRSPDTKPKEDVGSSLTVPLQKLILADTTSTDSGSGANGIRISKATTIY